MEVNRVISGRVNFRYKEFDSWSETFTFTQADNQTPAADFTGCTHELVVTKKDALGAVSVVTTLTLANGISFNPNVIHAVKIEYLPGFAEGIYEYKYQAVTAGGRKLTYIDGQIRIEK